MEKMRILFVSVFILINSVIFAQNDSTALWSYQLEGKAWHDWDSINNIWMHNYYFDCLKDNKLKMSCASCVSIYIDAIFKIDSSGKLTDIQIIKENVCSNKASDKLKQCFFSYYKNLIFPESLRRKKIKSKFGTGLKC
jgi:hypothetical protein